MRNLKIKSNEAGRSMIEMLGVLAIIGVLSVGGIAGYSKAMMKYRINRTFEQITLLTQNMRAFFGHQKTVVSSDALLYTILKKAKLAPDDMWNEGQLYVPISARRIEIMYDYDRRYFIQLNEITEDYCIELITQDWSVANIEAIVLYEENNFHSFTKLPINIDDAVKYCIDFTKYDTDGIEFYFKI